MSTIYITFIERESCFVKIWGQQDKSVALFIENALMQMKPQFDAGAGLLPADQLRPGALCCAKFKDDAYYRAHITSATMLPQGMVEVLFIDYGNRDLIQVTHVRSIYCFPTSVISLPQQAKPYVLARVQVGAAAAAAYADAGFELIASELRYLDFELQHVGLVGPYAVLLLLTSAGVDVTRSFIERQLAAPIDVSKQCLMLQNFVKVSTGQLVPIVGPVSAQLSPAGGGGLMAQQYSPPLQMQQPQQQQQQAPPMSPTAAGQMSFLTYKSLPLKVGTEHTVYVSYVTEGPCLFSIQLQNKELELQELMFELNKLPLAPIEENILPGHVCLARSLEDSYICRAVVTNMVEDKYKVFFVDFGNTEVRSFDNLFQIPFKYVIPKVMATRFALNGLQGQVVTVDMKIAFKNFVDNKAMKMRVCPPLPNTGVPLCDIWNAEGVSALDFVRGASLQAYPDPVPLSRGLSQDVKVSYVFSCVRFYVQLRKKEAELNDMMQKLQTTGMRAITPDLLKVNAPCIALYEADGMYYRAQIISADGASVQVRYVDYGNEENIPVCNMRAPIADFITNLRPQAIECCLNGYQNMELDQERDNLLEELMLEQYFSMKVVDVQGSRILVDLMDAQMYNVASLLLERMAKSRSQVSPALVQDNKIDHRKTTPTKYSPSITNSDTTKTDSWRENNRPLPQQIRSPTSDWRQNKEPSTESTNDYRQKVHSTRYADRNNRNSADGEPTPYQENRRPNSTWGERGNNRPPRDNNSADTDGGRAPRSNNHWGDNENQTDNKPRSDSTWNDNKRQNTWGGGGGGDRGDRRENSRENSWGDGNKRDNFNNRRENSFEKRENSFERKENSWDGNKRQDRDFNKRSSREDNNSWGGGDNANNRRPRRDNRSEDGSEKSFSSGKGFKGKRDNFGGSPPKKNFDENVDYAPQNEPFTTLEVIGTEQKVAISWFYNPSSFFLQPLSDKAKFDATMKDIQTAAYKRRAALETAAVGDSVIALFPEDRALYRATVLEEPIGGNFKVNYVDFGNSGVTSKIYKVERRFMQLPAQALQCGLRNIEPADAQWPKAATFAKYFGVDDLTCKFEAVTDKYIVELTSHGTSVKEELQKAGLIIVKNPYEHFNITYLLSQQIYCKVHGVQSMDNFSLEILPGLIVSCVVFKHDVATTPDLEMLKTFVGHMCIAYVDDVQDNKAFVTLYNISGKILPVIELQEDMFESVNPICPAVVIGPRIGGYVSHATATSVFVQTPDSAAHVELLLEQLYAHYETSEPIDVDIKEVIYAVRSSDANWYRGLVKKIDGEEITVQFIDYGNEEVVNKSVLRILTADFFTPYLATEIVVPEGKKYQDQEIRLQIAFGEDKWAGKVVEQPVTAPPTQPLEATPEETSTTTTPSASTTTPSATTTTPSATTPSATTVQQIQPIPEAEPEVHDHDQHSGQYQSVGFSVVLSHLDNPGQFYLQQSSALDAINELQDALQPQIPELADMENIAAGILCAAPYIVDEVWYRAQVLDADTDITTVRFVDFGNTDVLGSNVKPKTLPSELLSLEEHAKRCSLHLSPKDSEWTSEACTRFEDLTTNAALTIEIVHQDEKTTFVRLYADSVCVNDVFLQEGFATELQVTPAALTGFVSNLNSPSEFWLQFEHACSDLEWIAEQLVSGEKFNLLEDQAQAPGSLCAAIFPDDESWYRARILSNTVAGVEVLFIDYGNSCTCTSLRELPEDLVMVPALAHKCSLYKPQGLLEWSPKATEKIKEISADGVTVFTVVKHSQGETNHVQLFFNGDDVSEMLRPELVEAKLLSFNSLGDFALRKVDVEEKFVEVQGRIQELTDKPDTDETVVAALHDGVYYRAKVNGAIVDKFVVDLLDLGVEADVTELRQLPKDLVELQPLAMSVKMSPLVGFAFNAESDAYFKTLYENETVFHVEVVGDKLVRLYLNGCDVREKIPATKCTPINSLQNTPKKVKPAEEILSTETKYEHVIPNGVDNELSLEEEMRQVVNKLAANIGEEVEELIEVNVDDEIEVNVKEPEVVQTNAIKETDVVETEKSEVNLKEEVDDKIEVNVKAEVANKMAEDDAGEPEVVKTDEIKKAEGVKTENINEPEVDVSIDKVEEPTAVEMNKPDASEKAPDTKQSKQEASVSETAEEEALMKDAEMITTVTDDLIDRVSKQCNLLEDLTPARDVLTNGNELTNEVNLKAELEKAGAQKIEDHGEENVS